MLDLDLSKEVTIDLRKSNVSVNLTKGEYVNLSKNRLTGNCLRVGAGWNTKTESSFFGLIKEYKDVDLDIAVLLLDKDGRRIDKVFFNHLKSSGVQLDKDDRTGLVTYIDIDRMCNSLEKDNENVTIQLDDLLPSVAQIDIGVCIYDAQGKPRYTYKDIDNAYCKLVDETNKRVLCSVKMQNNGGSNKTLHVASLKKVNNEWVFEAINEFQPYKIGAFLRIE